jgi:hypothetical protein
MRLLVKPEENMKILEKLIEKENKKLEPLMN